MEETLKKAVSKALTELGISGVEPELEHPADLNHGDYSTNVALVAEGDSRENAEKIVRYIVQNKPNGVEKIEVAGPGFINFHLTRDFFTQSVENVDKEFGKSNHAKGHKVMVEYTDPNVMKPFHIGHLMSNAIGESFTRMMEMSGAEVKRANYFSDVGLGIAKAVWGMNDLLEGIPSDSEDIIKKTDFLGKAYAHGVKKFEEKQEIADEIKKINKLIYDRKDDNGWLALYEKGRKWSLERFDEIYKQLGTSFDYFYPESEVAADGKELVEKGLENGVFEESDGAVVFKGEKYGLHTRVFINSLGLATYEAKDLGLNKRKYEEYPFDASIIITANEQDEYFKVVLKAMEQTLPDIAKKTKHISHGMMRFAEGKMSSRTGNVITSEALVTKVCDAAFERMNEKNKMIAEQIALAAIKFSILKQAPGKDVIFDMEQSVSFEGDSGPYLQYTHVRTRALLEKARAEGVEPSTKNAPEAVSDVEKLLYRFPEVVERAAAEYAPQLVAQYLLSLAAAFNAFYAEEKIVDKKDEYSPYKLALAEKVGIALENGLWLLGIRTVPRM